MKGRNLFGEQVEVVVSGTTNQLRSALKLCLARLEEYPDAIGGTAVELARKTINETA